MSIIFIHGLGETEEIFSKMDPYIRGEKLFLNNWTLLGDQPRTGINALDFAKEIVQRYNITADDFIIGHSLGGWIAYHIKHLTRCRIVQIASWTNPKRIILPILNRKLIFWLLKRGLFFTRLQRWVYVQIYYKNKPSEEIFKLVCDRLRTGNRNTVISQVALVINPVPEKINVQPDLRIHSPKDSLVRCPAEPFHEVSGDHFTLYTHPQEVAAPINELLKK
jgi:pimeloyl-ACP methyl ester carboxylesterase